MLIKVLVLGLALSSIWFWVFAILRKEISSSMLKWWLKIIVPQGMIITYATLLLGLLS